jgi:hypothetical protein
MFYPANILYKLLITVKYAMKLQICLRKYEALFIYQVSGHTGAIHILNEFVLKLKSFSVISVAGTNIYLICA